MSRITCELLSHYNGIHTQQIYTGFFMLYKRGLIDLTQKVLDKNIIDTTKPQHLWDARNTHLRVILNGRLKLHYDAHDSWEIDEEYLREADFYFKRSFSHSYIENLGYSHKNIYPLGLNYPVHPSSLDFFALKRSKFADNKIEKLIEIARASNFFDNFIFTPRVHLMESLPDYESPPKILFIVNAWDPCDDPDRLQEKVEERNHINKLRADSIKLLRDKFRNNFYGGFIHTEFAAKNFKGLLLSDNTHTSKRNYIDLLKSFPICVATTGLHGSIGWKFAEYIAFSKAILSEKLNYEVAGNLEEGRNYLEFSSPEECVEKVDQLFSNRELRNYLMTNNARYYQSYLRPDSLILNTVLTALSQST